MTIQINRPETEALIRQRLQTGAFRDEEDVVLQALQSHSVSTAAGVPAKDMVELFAPLRGLNIDFESDRNKDIGRDINF